MTSMGSTFLALSGLAVLNLAAPAWPQDACATTTVGTAMLADYPAVRAFYDAITTGNPDLVACAVAPTWMNNPSAPGTPAGPAGFNVSGFRQIFGDYTFETQDVIVQDDKIVVRSLVTARQTGEFLGVPGGGDPVQFQTIDIHRLGENGKLAQSWHVEDWLTFLLQRGALPVQQSH